MKLSGNRKGIPGMESAVRNPDAGQPGPEFRGWLPGAVLAASKEKPACVFLIILKNDVAKGVF